MRDEPYARGTTLVASPRADRSTMIGNGDPPAQPTNPLGFSACCSWVYFIARAYRVAPSPGSLKDALPLLLPFVTLFVYASI